MKILHIAAFDGNVGDNASHLGFERILAMLLNNYHVDRIEIRKAYKNYTENDKLRFDDSFANLANSYDLVVFGGGGFLDYWVEGSSNGTTIDIGIDVLEKINTKILITSVGSNPHRKVPKENYNKFRTFLDYVRKSDRIKIALRNDGSIESIKRDIGTDYVSFLEEILDHGYFYKPEKLYTLPIEGKYVAINITDDQLSMQGGLTDERDWYYQELETVLTWLGNNQYKAVLIPHIHQDVEAIGNLMSRLPSSLIRNHTVVAPCIQSDEGADLIFSLYKNAHFTIASRYHANVCSLKFGTPTIGLSPLERIEYTHNQLTSSKTNVPIFKGFSQKIINLIESYDFDSMKVKDNLESLKLKTINFYKLYFQSV
ncbi:Polysaccharide pyruvyl transferase family protein [Vibrio chagasii]|nr:Polysaccharide pyruvyl transferase family protein [Vibrio chagasii]CAH6907364.1 Polysaccharide pyruvyl transferase family protein [Vibrio chagasii]CAH7178602.1 Polysaccharide pyruvyl transferase family protein [Vibrio chagasii]